MRSSACWPDCLAHTCAHSKISSVEHLVVHSRRLLHRPRWSSLYTSEELWQTRTGVLRPSDPCSTGRKGGATHLGVVRPDFGAHALAEAALRQPVVHLLQLLLDDLVLLRRAARVRQLGADAPQQQACDPALEQSAADFGCATKQITAQSSLKKLERGEHDACEDKIILTKGYGAHYEHHNGHDDLVECLRCQVAVAHCRDLLEDSQVEWSATVLSCAKQRDDHMALHAAFRTVVVAQ